MKKYLSAVAILLLTTSFSQEELIFETEDGEQVEVTVNSDNHTGIQSLNIWVGGYGGATKNAFVGANYYIPGKHLFGVQIGRGASLEGSSYFKEWTTTYNASHTLDSKNEGDLTKVFYAEIPHKSTTLLGAHYGISHYVELTDKYHSATSFNAGLTLTRVKHGSWTLSSEYGTKRGSHLFSVHLDGLWHFNHVHATDPSIVIVPQSQSPQGNEKWQIEVDSENALDQNTFGGRLYVEGSTLIWSKKGRVGLKYFLGGGVPPKKSGLYFLAGFGLSMGFL